MLGMRQRGIMENGEEEECRSEYWRKSYCDGREVQGILVDVKCITNILVVR